MPDLERGAYRIDKLPNDTLQLTFRTREKPELSTSGNSFVHFSTKGYKPIEGTDFQISVNLIISRKTLRDKGND